MSIETDQIMSKFFPNNFEKLSSMYIQYIQKIDISSLAFIKLKLILETPLVKLHLVSTNLRYICLLYKNQYHLYFVNDISLKLPIIPEEINNKKSGTLGIVNKFQKNVKRHFKDPVKTYFKSMRI